MSMLKNIVSIFCVATVAVGILSLLVPNGKMQKSMKCLLGLLLIAVVLSSFSGKIDIDLSFPQISINANSELTDTVNSQITNLSSKNIEQYIKQLLTQNGYKNAKVSVSMDISDESSINIGCIRFNFDNADSKKTDSAKQLIKNEFGENVKIICEGNVVD